MVEIRILPPVKSQSSRSHLNFVSRHSVFSLRVSSGSFHIHYFLRKPRWTALCDTALVRMSDSKGIAR